jgi:tetratricopeptide (TPR) repeat protein
VRELGWTCNSLATVADAAGRHDRALAATREAVTVSDALVRRSPKDFEARKVAAASLFSMALVSKDAEALSYWQRAGTLFESLLAERPDDPNNQRNVALVERYVGFYYNNTRQAIQALPHYERARTMDERRLQAYPSNRGVQVDVATDYALIAFQHKAVGHYAESAAGFERAVAMREAFVAADANDMQSRRLLAYSHTQLADAYELMGQYDKGEQHAQRAIALIEPLAGSSLLHRVDLFEAVRTLGRARVHTVSRAAGCADLERASRIAGTIESSVAQLPPALATRFEKLNAGHASDLAAWCGGPPAPPKTP